MSMSIDSCNGLSGGKGGVWWNDDNSKDATIPTIISATTTYVNNLIRVI